MTTGVTDFIKIDEVRQEINSTYPNSGHDAEGELEVENNGYGHRLIGDAFEFLCKILLYRRCSEVIIPCRRTFGGHRYILPGEGDFIVDDLLVHIKTTENRSFTNTFWRQLLMYYVLSDVQRVLHEVDGRTYSKEPFEGKYPENNRVGIYYARYGELQTVDMEEAIDNRGRYKEFRAWIVNRPIEDNRHAQHDYSAIRAVLTEPYDYKKPCTLFDYYSSH
jgi:hypothetical protein